MLELVDVFVWVTDPQKYADARLHDEFVSLMSHHDAVTLGVLNQSDRLDRRGCQDPDAGPREAPRRRRRRRRQGARDVHGDRSGHRRAQAATGECRCGTCGFASAPQGRCRRCRDEAASRRRRHPRPTWAACPREALDASLARAAGVPIVLDAVARDYRREAFAHTGWLFARWTKGFAADPLRRLRLDRTGGRPPIPVEIDGADVRAVLGRSSIPAPTVSTASAVDLATRSFVRDASEGLPVRWAQAVEDAVDGGDGDAERLARPCRHRHLPASAPSGLVVRRQHPPVGAGSRRPRRARLVCRAVGLRAAAAPASRDPRRRHPAAAARHARRRRAARYRARASCPGGGRASVPGTDGPSSASG